MSIRRYTPSERPPLKEGHLEWFSKELRRISTSIGTVIDELKGSLSSSLIPTQTNTYDLGTPSTDWKDAFVRNGVTATSDKRWKKGIRNFSDPELAVARRLVYLPLIYQWDDGQGDEGYHAGVIAQDVIKAFQDNHLDPFKYGVIYGAGDRYGVRYAELSQWQIAGLTSFMTSRLTR